MELDILLKEFCDKKGYAGHIKYISKTDKHHIVISKGDNNGGAFLTEEEYQDLNEEKLLEILELLHKGFQENYK